jgi:hypothetical protein
MIRIQRQNCDIKRFYKEDSWNINVTFLCLLILLLLFHRLFGGPVGREFKHEWLLFTRTGPNV